jgi:anti-anti-sigma factor
MPLKIHFAIDDGSSGGRQFVLSLYGELDSSTIAALSERIGRLPDGVRVCLDLRELTFLDSSGLSVIVSAKERFGDRLRIVGTQPPVEYVFKAAGAMRLLGEQTAD